MRGDMGNPPGADDQYVIFHSYFSSSIFPDISGKIDTEAKKAEEP